MHGYFCFTEVPGNVNLYSIMGGKKKKAGRGKKGFPYYFERFRFRKEVPHIFYVFFCLNSQCNDANEVDVNAPKAGKSHRCCYIPNFASMLLQEIQLPILLPVVANINS